MLTHVEPWSVWQPPSMRRLDAVLSSLLRAIWQLSDWAAAATEISSLLAQETQAATTSGVRAVEMQACSSEKGDGGAQVPFLAMLAISEGRRLQLHVLGTYITDRGRQDD